MKGEELKDDVYLEQMVNMCRDMNTEIKLGGIYYVKRRAQIKAGQDLIYPSL